MAQLYLEPRFPDNPSRACARDTAPASSSASVPSEAPAQDEGHPTGGEGSQIWLKRPALSSKCMADLPLHFPPSFLPQEGGRKDSFHPRFVSTADSSPLSLPVFLSRLEGKVPRSPSSKPHMVQTTFDGSANTSMTHCPPVCLPVALKLSPSLTSVGTSLGDATLNCLETLPPTPTGLVSLPRPSVPVRSTWMATCRLLGG